MELWGQIIGIVGMVVCCLSYQCFDKKKLLIVQTVGAGLLGVQYLLLGSIAGFTMNMVGLLRNFFYYHRDKKLFSGIWLPITMTVLMTVVGFLSWGGPRSLLIIVGLVVNTFCMGVCDSQQLRKSLLVTCPLVLVYSILEGALGGILNESISIISAVVGIVRYARSQRSAR
ncbi:MAG: YgjV family protein [Clostridia bacterium]|nr:YgjV family protein [Clostridia bacterium]